ncbi:MAG TPA: NUDIX hydrolase [Ktedonobacterales bacterium]|nr:NUDIX hydrolase [Ktedonobacterales bacterium]
MNRPQVGVAVIIEQNERVLLLKRKGAHGAGTWAPPGGHLEFGESLEECAIRETLEETGVVIGNVQFVAITNDIFASEQKHYVTIWVEGTYESGQATVAYPDKVQEVAWASWSALPQPLFLPLQNLLSDRQYPRTARFGNQPAR